MLEEKTILVQLTQGSTKALELLHKQYSHKIYNACRRFLLDHEDAEEVVQDVFLKIWSNRESIKLYLSFKAYVFTISKNLILKKLQKRVLKVTIDNYINSILYSTCSAEDQLVFKDVESLLEKIISYLPPKKQKIFMLNRFQGKSIEEISDELGLSKRTVESHIYQTRALIKEKLNINTLIFFCLVNSIFQ